VSAQYPQVLEPFLDSIMDGTMTEASSRQSVLRQLLVIRRKYNDPYQCGTPLYSDPTGSGAPDSRNPAPSTYPGCLAGYTYSQKWTQASQKARIEAAIAFLLPLVGAAVGSYPPIVVTNPNGNRIDSMGNFIPSGAP